MDANKQMGSPSSSSFTSDLFSSKESSASSSFGIFGSIFEPSSKILELQLALPYGLNSTIYLKFERLIIFLSKVGTAVVTRDDERLAVGRVGGIFEQLEELNSQGFDIILVSSGAVKAGRQRLKHRRLINSSFADLQKPQVELAGKACAAVGHNSLMALYSTLFSQ
ncbi:delta-1-pyrroline-5-carboxylate synthase-like [Camellia sinensis]|uniref:delta-1-pyrroline-5-carboxylate synthase-like n=1 Tax=Camellia sinensis TaxID=4442 RepID=UPI001035DEBE|nr:delta-1-pyrroline-5-carboxylate synthase-like [Camellia sinensis]